MNNNWFQWLTFDSQLEAFEHFMIWTMNKLINKSFYYNFLNFRAFKSSQCIMMRNALRKDPLKMLKKNSPYDPLGKIRIGIYTIINFSCKKERDIPFRSDRLNIKIASSCTERGICFTFYKKSFHKKCVWSRIVKWGCLRFQEFSPLIGC